MAQFDPDSYMLKQESDLRRLQKFITGADPEEITNSFAAGDEQSVMLYLQRQVTFTERSDCVYMMDLSFCNLPESVSARRAALMSPHGWSEVLLTLGSVVFNSNKAKHSKTKHSSKKDSGR